MKVGEEVDLLSAESYIGAALRHARGKCQWRSTVARAVIGCSVGTALVHFAVMRGAWWGYERLCISGRSYLRPPWERF